MTNRTDLAEHRMFVGGEWVHALGPFLDACDLGLTSAVFTKDIDRDWHWAERLRTGLTVINDRSSYREFHIPFGGRAGTRSGLGRIGGRSALGFMSEVQVLAFHTESGN